MSQISRKVIYPAIFFAIFLAASTVFAETVEIVTYFPTTGGNNEHVNDLTVGPGFLGENPANGVALIETRLGIGTNDPQQQLHITGNLRIPSTTAVGGVPSGGVIFSDTTRFIHRFGSGNFFAGTAAGNFTLTGSSNIGIGTNAMQSLTNGIQNVAVGSRAMELNTSGQRNSAFGMESLNNNTTGGLNTALGHNTLFFNQTGFNNTAVGYQALLNTTGSDNVAVGQNAGSALLANANTTGSGNTFIGTRSGSGVAAQLTNATALGFEALVSASNALVLGGTGANAVSVGIGTETPQATLDVTSDGGTILVPRKSTAGDPAVGVNGMIYYNANAQQFRFHQNGAWQSLDGGWRLIFRDDFQANANGWAPATRTNIGGATILGGFSTAGNGTTLTRNFDLTGIAHTQIKVELDYYAIDSWDGEFGFVFAAGAAGSSRNIWAERINQFDPGRINFGGAANRTDGVYHALLTGSHSTNTLTVSAGCTLDQASNDESFGIDNVEVWVR